MIKQGRPDDVLSGEEEAKAIGKAVATGNLTGDEDKNDKDVKGKDKKAKKKMNPILKKVVIIALVAATAIGSLVVGGRALYKSGYDHGKSDNGTTIVVPDDPTKDDDNGKDNNNSEVTSVKFTGDEALYILQMLYPTRKGKIKEFIDSKGSLEVMTDEKEAEKGIKIGYVRLPEGGEDLVYALPLANCGSKTVADALKDGSATKAGSPVRYHLVENVFKDDEVAKGVSDYIKTELGDTESTTKTYVSDITGLVTAASSTRKFGILTVSDDGSRVKEKQGSVEGREYDLSREEFYSKISGVNKTANTEETLTK